MRMQLHPTMIQSMMMARLIGQEKLVTRQVDVEGRGRGKGRGIWRGKGRGKVERETVVTRVGGRELLLARVLV